MEAILVTYQFLKFIGVVAGVFIGVPASCCGLISFAARASDPSDHQMQTMLKRIKKLTWKILGVSPFSSIVMLVAALVCYLLSLPSHHSVFLCVIDVAPCSPEVSAFVLWIGRASLLIFVGVCGLAAAWLRW